MFSIEDRLDEWRQQFESKHALRREVVDELESHLVEAFEENLKSMPEELSFQRALASLGENRQIASEFQMLESINSIQNIMKNLIFGGIVAILGLLGSTAMIGADFSLFFHPAELSAVVIIPIGTTVMSFGLGRFLRALSCIFSARHFSMDTRTVLHRWLSATYAAGVLFFIVGLAFVLSDLQNPGLGGKISAGLCAPIYAIVIAELLLRSTLAKLNDQLAAG